MANLSRRLTVFVLSTFVLFALVPTCGALEQIPPAGIARAIVPATPVLSGTTPTTASITATPSTDTTLTTPTPTSPTTPTTVSPTTVSTIPTATTSSPTSAAPITPTTPTTPTGSTAPTTTPPTATAAPPALSTLTSTSAGIVVTVVVGPSTTATTSSASATPSTSQDDTSKSLGTGSIIGLSVAGGITVIGIVAFFIWKFTRKRFSDFDDNEAIKWPELNSHGEDSHPLPVNSTGRAGFDTGSQVSLSRVNSTGTGTGYSGNIDPYAVPPLPHLNPNQPYRDDPAASNYYDPYHGPVPTTFNDAASTNTARAAGVPGEAIPLTQMAPSIRTTSPGPQMFDMGRASPQPSLAGRRSPAPQMALGYDAAAGFAGRRSPGPQAAYDPSYGPR